MAALRAATRAALGHRLGVEQAQQRLPSVVAALWRGGQVIWSGVRGGTGLRDGGVDTQYRIGSISKTFTAVLVMRLRDEGALALTDPVDGYLPGTPLSGRTLAHLLSHGSGLSSEITGPWWERSYGRSWEELAGSLGPEQVLHPAGQTFHYSNPGTAILGHVVEVVRGRSWFEVLGAEVLAPLGLRRTTYHPEPPCAQGLAVHPYADLVLPEPTIDTAAMAPAGQLWSTVGDLARWGAFLAGAGQLEAGPGAGLDAAAAEGVLRAASRQEMRRPIHVGEGQTWDWGYGLGVSVVRTRGRRLVGHGGTMPGFVASLLAQEETSCGAVALANATGSPPDGLTLDLLDLLDRYEPAEPKSGYPPRWPRRRTNCSARGSGAPGRSSCARCRTGGWTCTATGPARRGSSDPGTGGSASTATTPAST